MKKKKNLILSEEGNKDQTKTQRVIDNTITDFQQT